MDFPFILPDKKTDFSKCDISSGLNLLSFNKPVTVSSSLGEHGAGCAVDENFSTWWSAESGQEGEWLQVDLGRDMEIGAVQVCFADESFLTYRHDTVPTYKYILEGSVDGNNWHVIADRSDNEIDQIYELVVLDEPQQNRYVRIRNAMQLSPGKFSLSGLRVFGDAHGDKPERVNGLKVTRGNDRRRISFEWNDQENVLGYVVRWGVSPERLCNSAMVFDNKAEFGFFDKEQTYFITVEPFNESGRGPVSDFLRVD